MTSFAEGLREKSREQRQAAAVILESIERSPNVLREQLVAAQGRRDVEAMRAEIGRIADSIPNGSTERRVITAITGFVSAEVMELLAEQCDYFTATGSLKRVSDKLREHRELQHDLRIAIATGDDAAWDRAIERLASSTSSRSAPSGNGSEGGEREGDIEEPSGSGGS